MALKSQVSSDEAHIHLDLHSLRYFSSFIHHIYFSSLFYTLPSFIYPHYHNVDLNQITDKYWPVQYLPAEVLNNVSDDNLFDDLKHFFKGQLQSLYDILSTRYFIYFLSQDGCEYYLVTSFIMVLLGYNFSLNHPFHKYLNLFGWILYCTLYESHWNDRRQAGGNNLNMLWNFQIYIGKSRSYYLRFAWITNLFGIVWWTSIFPTLLIWLVELQIWIPLHLRLTKERIFHKFYYMAFTLLQFQFIDSLYLHIPCSHSCTTVCSNCFSSIRWFSASTFSH